jgi:hypothetical protein
MTSTVSRMRLALRRVADAVGVGASRGRHVVARENARRLGQPHSLRIIPADLCPWNGRARPPAQIGVSRCRAAQPALPSTTGSPAAVGAGACCHCHVRFLRAATACYAGLTGRMIRPGAGDLSDARCMTAGTSVGDGRTVEGASERASRRCAVFCKASRRARSALRCVTIGWACGDRPLGRASRRRARSPDAGMRLVNVYRRRKGMTRSARTWLIERKAPDLDAPVRTTGRVRGRGRAGFRCAGSCVTSPASRRCASTSRLARASIEILDAALAAEALVGAGTLHGHHALTYGYSSGSWCGASMGARSGLPREELRCRTLDLPSGCGRNDVRVAELLSRPSAGPESVRRRAGPQSLVGRVFGNRPRRRM